jgi:hypothetical protein
MQAVMKRGEIQPATKATERPAPIADADKSRRAVLRAFQTGDCVSERILEPA